MTELEEAAAVRAEADRLVDQIGGAGIAERTAIVGIHLALVERMLRANGVKAAQDFLRDQADQLDDWGPAYLAALRR